MSPERRIVLRCLVVVTLPGTVIAFATARDHSLGATLFGVVLFGAVFAGLFFAGEHIVRARLAHQRPKHRAADDRHRAHPDARSVRVR